MTIAQSLEHSWIKVRQWGCPHVGMAGVSSPWHGGGSPGERTRTVWGAGCAWTWCWSHLMEAPAGVHGPSARSRAPSPELPRKGSPPGPG